MLLAAVSQLLLECRSSDRHLSVCRVACSNVARAQVLLVLSVPSACQFAEKPAELRLPLECISSAGYCWGFNDSGRLGDGTITQRREPQTVIDAHLWRSISAGGYHTCGVTTSNTAYCWGLGSYGQLGNRISAASSTPIQVSNPG